MPDKETERSDYLKSLSADEACAVIEALAKIHGGEIIDRVVDKMIQDGETLEKITRKP